MVSLEVDLSAVGIISKGCERLHRRLADGFDGSMTGQIHPWEIGVTRKAVEVQ